MMTQTQVKEALETARTDLVKLRHELKLEKDESVKLALQIALYNIHGMIAAYKNVLETFVSEQPASVEINKLHIRHAK